MKRLKTIHFPFIMLAAWLILSCDNGSDCALTNVAYSNYGFYNSSGTAVKYADTLTIYLKVNGADSVVVNRSLGTSSLKLPVCYTQSIDTLIFKYSHNVIDSIFMHHSNIPYFISLDCGTAMYHQIEEVTSSHNYIDTIQVTNPQINYNEKENIKIYFAD